MNNAFLMDRPVSAEQLIRAAHALGFVLHPTNTATGQGVEPATEPVQDPAMTAGSHPGATVLLAMLDAITVRWQIDQDLRDPLNENTRRTIAMFAQTAVAEDTGDLLAAALWRLRTVSCLLAVSTENRGAAGPGAAVAAAVSAAASLVAAWIAGYALEHPAQTPDHPAAAAATTSLDEDTVRNLALHSQQQLAAAAAALQQWRQARRLG